MIAFVGMLFFTMRRWPETGWLVKIAGSFFWAFVILLVDRIVVATYRPFEPLRRRLLQAAGRIVLAGVVSALIALPFCLDLYSASIMRFYHEFYDLQAESLRIKYETEKQAILNVDRQAQATLDSRLRPIDEKYPQSQTLDGLIEQRVRQWKEDPSQVEPGVDTLQSRQDVANLDKSLTEVESEVRALDGEAIALQIARDKEAKGEANSVYETPSGRGCLERCQKIEEDLKEKRTLLQAAKSRLEKTRRQRDAAQQRLEDAQRADLQLQLGRQAEIRARLTDSAKREVEEVSKERRSIDEEKRRSQNLTQQQLASLDRRNQRLQRYEAFAMAGELDPLEEMLGLYYVILGIKPELFSTQGDGNREGLSVRLAAGSEAGTLRWLLAAFQLLTVYGTLFVLDLVPLLAKLMSPSGSYDAIISANETIARENYNAFRRSYPRGVQDWAEAQFSAIEGYRANLDGGPDIRQPATLYDLVMRVHRPPSEAPVVYPEADPAALPTKGTVLPKEGRGDE